MARLARTEISDLGNDFVDKTEPMVRIRQQNYPSDFTVVKFSVSVKKKQGILEIIPKYKKIANLSEVVNNKNDFDAVIADIFNGNKPNNWKGPSPSSPMKNSLSINNKKYSCIVFVIDGKDLYFQEKHAAFKVELGRTHVLFEDNRVVEEGGNVVPKAPGQSAPACKVAYFLANKQDDHDTTAFNIYVRLTMQVKVNLDQQQPTADVSFDLEIDPGVGHPGGNY